jgi:hypothetical protein
VAVQAAILSALKRGWGVLQPVGDRLPYDLVFDVAGQLVRVQVKSAWYDRNDDVWLVDTRRTQTNRRVMKRSKYRDSDFDFALAFLPALELFYVLPSVVFNAYAGSISFVESSKRQRQPRSAEYRCAWALIPAWAAQRETSVRTPAKFGEASCGGNPEPSPVLVIREGVET